MITVHHLETSRSHRVLWLLEELGVPYELERYQRDRNLMAGADLRAVHPLGKSPVITDGELTLAESGAILEYLVERHGGGRLAPARGTPAHVRYLYWMHYAEGSLTPLLLLALVAEKIRTTRVPFFIKPITGQIASKLRKGYVDVQLERHLSYVDDELGKAAWFTGDELSAADIQMSYPVEAAVSRLGKLAAGRSNMKRFVEAVRARPAYQRALEQGGPMLID